MGFLDNIRNFKHQMERVENSVYTGKQSFLEVYELNAKLEEEIAQRTKELDTANRQMLTLRHILDMMNSSEPLSSVLNAIVISLKGDLGYSCSCIAKRCSDEQGEYIKMLAYSGTLFEEHFKDTFKIEPYNAKFTLPNIEELTDSLNKNEIYQSPDVTTIIKSTLPEIPNNVEFDQIVKKMDISSYINIPLMYKHTHFGSLIVFSTREVATEKEINFLKLFAKQIEIAITIADLFQAVKEQAITDGMTGLYNRRYFEEYIQKEADRSVRQNLKFTVIGIDLDHLKHINDTYGHNYGDIAIKAISGVLKSSCRAIDIAARMGGEEFNVILPGVDTNGGKVFAERIRKTIENIKLDKIGNITASIGVGTFGEHSSNIDELLELVDHAMYNSKRNGRNQVSIAKRISETSWQEIAIDTFSDILSRHSIPLDKKTYDILNEKLHEMTLNKDIIYQVADTLVSTYNPDSEQGNTKKKVLLSTLLAKRFDLSKESIDKLKIAMLLYDIGNTMLPKEILNKTAPLSEEELSSIKQHPIIAAREILQPISYITDIIPIIEKHHENWNGTGYPGQLSGSNIPIESQIILIIDAYFALMENRPYRKAMSQKEALNIIKKDAGYKWSENLANEFVSVINNEDIND